MQHRERDVTMLRRGWSRTGNLHKHHRSGRSRWVAIQEAPLGEFSQDVAGINQLLWA